MAAWNERIGLFGGTFDPIHSGHILLAEEAIKAAGLDRIIFIPTAFPPHKMEERITGFDARVDMVRLAIKGKEHFELSLLESAESISYTYRTVNFFARRGYDRTRLHLLVGSDSFMEIMKWRKPKEIFSRATLLVLERPAFESAPALPEGAAVIWVRSKKSDISSSLIRRLRSEGRSIRGLVPRSVERYIENHSLYIS